MPRKVGRSAKVEIYAPDVGTVTITSLEGKASFPEGFVPVSTQASLVFAFEVTKTLSPDPNRATIWIYNLNRISRDRVSGITRRKVAFGPEALGLPGLAGINAELADVAMGLTHVKLFAGYGRALQQIFEGDTQTVRHRRPDNVTWETELDTGDTATRMRASQIQKTYAAGTPVLTTIIDVAGHMGVSIAADSMARLNAWLAGSVHEYGATIAGNCPDVMTALLDIANIVGVDVVLDRLEAGLETDVRWSIQDGELVVFGPRDVLAQPPVDLRPETGLVGRPELLENGAISVQALMDPNLRPGATVALTSRDVTGAFRVDSVRHSGTTDSGGSFISECQLMSVVPGVAA
jgi:hypothetical protein